MNARIHTIMFDAEERPLGAVIFTSRGIVEAVRNQDGWTMLGAPAAKKLALSAMRRVERWPAPIHRSRKVASCRYCGRPSEDGSGVCAKCERNYERR